MKVVTYVNPKYDDGFDDMPDRPTPATQKQLDYLERISGMTAEELADLYCPNDLGYVTVGQVSIIKEILKEGA